MTFISSAGSAAAIAFAADTLVNDGHGNASFNRKLFVLAGRLCAASYGSGPNVPTTMDGVQIGTRTTRQAAEYFANICRVIEFSVAVQLQ